MISVNDFLNEYELMGWVIEMRWSPENWEVNPKMPNYTSWGRQWNHKIYKTEEIAKQAMAHSGTWLRKNEYRYRPVYAKKMPEEQEDERSVATKMP